MSKPGRFQKLDRRWSMALNEHEIELTELELSVLRLSAAFNRWNEAACFAVGGEQLTASEVNLLHIIGMQGRPKNATTVASLLNRDDQANIQYGLRKLRKLDLITVVPGRNRKSFDYDVTPKGRELVGNFSELAREIVYSATASIDQAVDRFVISADILRILTGIFDESARVAQTYCAWPSGGDENTDAPMGEPTGRQTERARAIGRVTRKPRNGSA